MRRAIAIAACLGIVSPVLADPEPPHPVDPLPPLAANTRRSPPPDSATRPSTYAPPAANPGLPVVTVSTMPVPIYARAPDTEPRTAAWIATGVVAAFAIATEGWWLYRNKFESRGLTAFDDPNCKVLTGVTDPNCYTNTLSQQAIHDHNAHIWNYTELGFASAMGLSAFVAGYLWSRHFHPLRVVGFAPTSGGGSVSLGGSF